MIYRINSHNTVDGLLLKVAYDFLVLLEKRGLSCSSIRIKFLPKDPKFRNNVFRTSAGLEQFEKQYGSILNDRRYLCSTGDFPVIENIVLTNKNLRFDNSYSWYNITDKRKLVQTIQYDYERKNIYEAEIQRYLALLNELFDQYTANVNKSLKERLNVYVDPCYVDAGYISPN